MPTDARTWSILRHQHVLKCIRVNFRERGSARPEWKQKLRNLAGLAKLPTPGILILPTKRHDAPLPFETMKVKLLEWQLTHAHYQRLFNVTIDERRLIRKAVELILIFEQTKLRHHNQKSRRKFLCFLCFFVA